MKETSLGSLAAKAYDKGHMPPVLRGLGLSLFGCLLLGLTAIDEGWVQYFDHFASAIRLPLIYLVTMLLLGMIANAYQRTFRLSVSASLSSRQVAYLVFTLVAVLGVMRHVLGHLYDLPVNLLFTSLLILIVWHLAQRGTTRIQLLAVSGLVALLGLLALLADAQNGSNQTFLAVVASLIVIGGGILDHVTIVHSLQRTHYQE
ncbi:MAG: hypothetical protein ACFLMY_11810 [Candidatus Brachytrichaceae bacterium NZ_4S206]|jgi:hypothetical protein